MLILILIDVQYLQNVISSFDEGSKGQNHSLPDSYHPIKNPPANIPIPPPLGAISPYTLTLFGTPWYMVSNQSFSKTSCTTK